MPHAGQGHQRKPQSLADLHGHQLHFVAARVKVASADAIFHGQFTACQHLGTKVLAFDVCAQHVHVAPGEAFFVCLARWVCNRKGFFAQAGKFDDEGLGSFAAAADGFDEGDAIVVFVPVIREAQAPSAGMRVAMLLLSQYLVVPDYEAYNEVFKEIFIIHMNISQISSDEFQVEITYIRENEHGVILTFIDCFFY